MKHQLQKLEIHLFNLEIAKSRPMITLPTLKVSSSKLNYLSHYSEISKAYIIHQLRKQLKMCQNKPLKKKIASLISMTNKFETNCNWKRFQQSDLSFSSQQASSKSDWPQSVTTTGRARTSLARKKQNRKKITRVTAVKSFPKCQWH